MNYKERTIKKDNLNYYLPTAVGGPFDIPKLQVTDYAPTKMVGFNYVMNKQKPSKDLCVHFFLEDMQFERIWKCPAKYIERLSQYGGVLTPDFSLYENMPIAQRIWNTYRNRLVGHIFQLYGLNVIPTVSWNDKDTYCFAFEGLEEGCTVAVSTQGCAARTQEGERLYKQYKEGIKHLIKKVKPKTIIVYGPDMKCDYKGTHTIHIKNDFLEGLERRKEELKSDSKQGVVQAGGFLTKKEGLENVHEQYG